MYLLPYQRVTKTLNYKWEYQSKGIRPLPVRIPLIALLFITKPSPGDTSHLIIRRF